MTDVFEVMVKNHYCYLYTVRKTSHLTNFFNFVQPSPSIVRVFKKSMLGKTSSKLGNHSGSHIFGYSNDMSNVWIKNVHLGWKCKTLCG